MDKGIRLIAEGMRYGAQCIFPAGLRTYDLLQIARLADTAGYQSIDVWGYGAIEPAITLAHDDPWVRLKSLRRAMPDVTLRATFHATRFAGEYDVSEELAEKCINLAVKNGIDEFAVFEENNKIVSSPVFRAAKKSGKPVVGVLTFHKGEFSTVGELAKKASEYEAAGAAAIALVDDHGVLIPSLAYNMVRTLKEAVSLPIEFGCTNQKGMAAVCSWEAARAGADTIRTVFSCMFGNSSYPSSESLVASFEHTAHDTGMPIGTMIDINNLARDAAARRQKDPALDGFVPETKCLSWETAAKQYKDLVRSEEDTILCALYPKTAPDFLRCKYGMDN